MREKSSAAPGFLRTAAEGVSGLVETEFPAEPGAGKDPRPVRAAGTHSQDRGRWGACLLGGKDPTGRFVLQPDHGYFCFRPSASSASARKRRSVSASALSLASVSSCFSNH